MSTLIDPRTAILMASLLGGLMALVLELLRRTTPEPVPGMLHWVRATALVFVTAMLFGLRDKLPDVLTITLGNGLLLIAYALYLQGSHLHFGVPMRWRVWVVMWLVCMTILTWYAHAEPSFRGRSVVMLASMAAIMGYHAWFLFGQGRQRASGMSFGVRFAAVSLASITLVFVLRWVHVVMLPQDGSHLFAPNWVQSVYTLSYSLAVLMFTVGLALMASERVRESFQFQATHDMLTGVLNRRAVLDALAQELARSLRYQRPFAVLMLDLDHFKAVNDRHGHQVGDQVLQRFVQRVSATLRPNDVLGRFGGEEFVVLLPETNGASALATAERVRQAVRQPDPALPTVSVSIGLTDWQTHDRSVDALIERSDRALYVAKSRGRDRVETVNT